MSLYEINLNIDASQFEITKIEEQRAFNYYKEKLLPEDVKAFNVEVAYRAHYYPQYSNVEVVTAKEVTDSMRKTYHGKAIGISGTQIKYVAEIPQQFNIDPAYFTLEMSREKVGFVTLRTWHTFANITVKTELNEAFEPLPPDWGDISKTDESAGFQVIKEKWVPVFVQGWNQFHPVHKVTEREILKTLRKVRHDSLQQPEDYKKWPRSDIIHYQAPLPGPYKYVTFMIHRFANSSSKYHGVKDGTLMAGYFSGTAVFEKPVYAN